eukprot:GHRR01002255.1.p1 GENE.GHRR01002255.1~~GHRR01002255.1.p1  ORF type:complete len:329 (+),score=124.55 GHRR01002255.1:736-1722(+)
MGTSAGALAGSLYAAGYSPGQIAHTLSEKSPIEYLRPNFDPWRGGLLSLEGVIDRLRELLPPTFEGLKRDFAVGVVTADGLHVLIDQGPLPEAVAASAAIPFIFATVDVPGLYMGLKDGGMVDRVGLAAWRQRRRQQQKLLGRRTSPLPPCLVHVIDRSSPFSGFDNAEAIGESAVHIVKCPKSGVNFFDLGDFSRQFENARSRASTHLMSYSQTLELLPQINSQQQQQQRLLTNNAVPAKGVSGAVVVSGFRGQAAGSNSNRESHPVGAGGLVVAATGREGGASSSGSSSGAGAAAAPAGMMAARPAMLSFARTSGLRRAVPEDGNN